MNTTWKWWRPIVAAAALGVLVYGCGMFMYSCTEEESALALQRGIDIGYGIVLRPEREYTVVVEMIEGGRMEVRNRSFVLCEGDSVLVAHFYNNAPTSCGVKRRWPTGECWK